MRFNSKDIADLVGGLLFGENLGYCRLGGWFAFW